MLRTLLASLSVFLTVVAFAQSAEPIVIADFEGADYGNWKVNGEAFGKGPAPGTLPGQMHVEGYQGKGLVNSFSGGDDSTGSLTSPTFKLERKFITFLIGGGGYANETCINLIVDGKVVRSATGPNTTAGNSERLAPAAWDVKDFVGRDISLMIVDSRKGGWGHINIDHIVQTDDRGNIPIVVPPAPLVKDVTREVVAQKKLLHFPVKTGAQKRNVTVSVDGQPARKFEIELADGEAEWLAPLDVSAWSGKKLVVTVDVLPENSKALDSLQQSDTFLSRDQLYREALRPQFHFSAKRGWLNDPNGLVLYNGEYHLFFQHNPYGWGWGNMHWGNATSKDLVHWQEHGEALYPDDLGPMFSGSAVVDWKNTSGFGKEGKPPLVLIYTAAGNPTTQCIAYSNDGRTFTKYEKNPVVKEITGGNRDPKVCWHEPSKQWVMVVYVALAGERHTVHFFTSSNLREWTLASITEGGTGGDKYLFECPDLFELPVDGDAKNKKWVLNAANSEYAIGTFDGKKFTPETSRLPDVRGVGFYAAQTYSDLADGRRVQIGWCQAASPGMAFNQLQSIPSELSLRTTPQGIRLSRTPVKELASLRDGANQADSLNQFKGDLIELCAEFEPREGNHVEFKLRGATLVYDPKSQEIVVNGHKAPAPLVDGKQKIIAYVDRTIIEVFASDGLTYVPMPFIPGADEQSVSTNISTAAKTRSLEVYRLKSIWPEPSK